jgi:hypothetical protein
MEKYSRGSLLHLELLPAWRLRFSRQKYCAGARFQQIGLWNISKAVPRREQINRTAFPEGINRQMPLNPDVMGANGNQPHRFPH